MQISTKDLSYGTPTSVNTDTNIYGYQTSWIIPILPFFVEPPTNLNVGVFTTRVGFMRPLSPFGVEPIESDPSLFLTVISYLPRTFLLMNFKHHFSPSFCGLFIPWHNFTLLYHYLWLITYHKLVFDNRSWCYNFWEIYVRHNICITKCEL